MRRMLAICLLWLGSMGAVQGLPEVLPVPDVRQSTSYSCGAAALQAVLAYYGIDAREGDLILKLGSVPVHGTRPEAIVKACLDFGLRAELRQHTRLEDVERELQERRPVIVDVQAWREGAELNLPWSRVWESGHYMVAIGLDADNLYLEDPSLLGSRGFIRRSEFEERWHDYETGPGGERQEYHRAAIFVRGRAPAIAVPWVQVP